MTKPEVHMKVKGVVRGLSGRTKLEPLVIHLSKGADQSTPNPKSIRLPVKVRIAGQWYSSGLILRKSPPPLASISPTLIDKLGKRTTLAKVLKAAGIPKNQRLEVEVSEVELSVRNLPGA
jgi:hypothetical protein